MITMDITERAEPFLRHCDYCDDKSPVTCTCPDEDARPTLVLAMAEVTRLRAELADAQVKARRAA
jgi:hypothetical protein